MMHEILDQSSFSHDQERFLAPPEVLEQKLNQPEKKPWPIQKKALVGTGVIFCLILFTGIIHRTFFFVPVVPEIVVPPSPTPIIVSETQLQKELGALKDTLNAANPHTYSFPPPPVDMNVVF